MNKTNKTRKYKKTIIVSTLLLSTASILGVVSCSSVTKTSTSSSVNSASSSPINIDYLSNNGSLSFTLNNGVYTTKNVIVQGDILVFGTSNTLPNNTIWKVTLPSNNITQATSSVYKLIIKTPGSYELSVTVPNQYTYVYKFNAILPTISNDISINNKSDNNSSISFNASKTSATTYTTKSNIYLNQTLVFNNKEQNVSTSWTLIDSTTKKTVLTNNSSSFQNQFNQTGNYTLIVDITSNINSSVKASYTYNFAVISTPVITAIFSATNSSNNKAITLSNKNNVYKNISEVYENQNIVFNAKIPSYESVTWTYSKNQITSSSYTALMNAVGLNVITAVVSLSTDPNVKQSYTFNLTVQKNPVLNAKITCLNKSNNQPVNMQQDLNDNYTNTVLIPSNSTLVFNASNLSSNTTVQWSINGNKATTGNSVSLTLNDNINFLTVKIYSDINNNDAISYNYVLTTTKGQEELSNYLNNFSIASNSNNTSTTTLSGSFNTTVIQNQNKNQLLGYNNSVINGLTLNDAVTMPSNWIYDGKYYTISSISKGLFLNSTLNASLTIPNQYNSIANYGFSNSTFNAQLNLPDTLWNDALSTNYMQPMWSELYSHTYLISSPFSSCTFNYDFALPSNVKTIGNLAFSADNFKDPLVLDNSITSIGTYSFAFCTFPNLTLSNDLSSVGNYAFSDDIFVSNLSIPTSWTSIASDTFFNCTFNQEFTIPNKVNVQSSAFSGSLFKNTLQVLNNQTTMVGFNDCTFEKQLFLPNSITALNGGLNSCVFEQGLILDNNLITINALNDVTFDQDFSIPNSVKTLALMALQNDTFNATLNMSNTLWQASIDNAQYANSNATSVYYHDVFNYAFSIPACVSNIATYAFENVKFKALIIPNTVKSIQYNAFFNADIEQLTNNSNLSL